MQSSLQKIHIPAFSFFLILSLITWAYWPGTSGGFLFDDFPNLSPIGDSGNIDSFQKLKAFVSSGFSGPTGRPVSLLSFLLDDNTWPAIPFGFKVTNICFHLIATCLVCWLSYLCAKALDVSENKAGIVAILTMALWGLHPFWASTTLYVVQRMTILSAIFCLAGIVCFVKGRFVEVDYPKQTTLLWFLGIAVFGLLSVYSKENGALLPLFCFVIDRTLLINIPRNKSLYQSTIFHFAIHLPCIIVVLALIKIYIQTDNIFSTRHFTMEERILTEWRIIFTYLQNLFVPRSITSGLFTDNIKVSEALFQPVSTLFSGLALIMLIASAVIVRKKWSVYSCAIIFFLIGHVMESTFVPLELYFEHRNYLPSIFIFFFLAYALVTYSSENYQLSLAVGVVFIAGLTYLLHERASNWANTETLPILWAAKAPNSLRANQSAAQYWIKKGNGQIAEYHLRFAHQANSDNPLPLIYQLSLDCRLNRNKVIDKYAVIDKLTNYPYHIETFHAVKQLIDVSHQNSCITNTKEDLLEYAQSLKIAASKISAGHEGLALHLLGNIELNFYKNSQQALNYYNFAIRKKPDMEIGMVQIANFANAFQYKKALSHWEKVRDLNKNLLSTGKLSYERWQFYNEELERFKTNLSEDLRKNNELHI